MAESDYLKGLNAEDRQNYLRKLTLSSGDKLPDPFSLENWSDDIAFLPSISWRDVTEYLIDTPSVYTKEALKAYKSLDAYDYFVCGHVQDCFYHGISEDNQFCFMKAQVIQKLLYLFY